MYVYKCILCITYIILRLQKITYMAKKKNEGKVMKNIHLDRGVLKKLNVIAAKAETTTKAYIEELCIDVSKAEK